MAGVDNDALFGHTQTHRQFDALPQERRNLARDIRIVRARVLRPRCRERVHDDQARVTVGDNANQVVIAETGGVVHRRGPRLDAAPGHLRMKGVDRDHHIGCFAQCRDDRHHPIGLLLDRQWVARRERNPADVHPIRTIGDGPQGGRERILEGEVGPAVIERVGRAVDDRHDRDLP